VAQIGLKKRFWQNTEGLKGTIVLAIIVSYVAAYCAHILGTYFPVDSLYKYNKYFVIILTCVLLSKIFTKRINHLELPGFIWFGVFFIFALLHGFYPGGNRYFDIAWALTKIYIFFLVIINLFKTKKECTILGMVFLSVTTVTLIEYYVHAKQHGWGSRVTAEELGFYINANTVSYIAVLAFIIYMFITRDSHFRGRLFFQLLILAGAITIVSINASIGAISLLTITVVLTVLNLKNIRTSILSICIILAIGYIYYKYHPYTGIVRDRIETKIELGRYDDRADLTFQALSIFLDEPIWGKGYDSFYRYEGETFNHLWYLNVLVAYGIFGLMFIFVWFTRIFPVKTFFISPYSTMLVIYTAIFLLLAPPPIFFSILMAFLYWETRHKLFAEPQFQRTIMPRQYFNFANALKQKQ